MPKISNLLPINLAQVKQEFFKSPNFNPQFSYSNSFTQSDLLKHGLPNEATFQLAQEIINKAYHAKTEAELFASEGKLLSQAEVTQRTHAYLSSLGLDKRFQISWSDQYLVRSSATKDEIKFRIPSNFREEGFQGMLYHEIGTHVLRRLNDEMQPWHGQRKKYNLQPYLETEEGLASLHSQLPRSIPYNFIDSLRYLAVYTAQQESFLDVWQALTPYVDDLDRRWMICVRAKRGLTDTSQPGGYTKDMLYLSGSIKVWQWIANNSDKITSLYLGKLSLSDCLKLENKAKIDQLVIPKFMKINQDEYYKKICHIGEINGFDQI